MSNIKKARRNCKFCNKLLDKPVKFYCNNSCQGKYQVLERYRDDPSSLGPKGLKTYLLLTRENVCSVCKGSTWNNLPIPLETDHINGDYSNNSDDNLRLICPNCHSQTDTYKGKNVGKGRYKRRARYEEGKSY